MTESQETIQMTDAIECNRAPEIDPLPRRKSNYQHPVCPMLIETEEESYKRRLKAAGMNRDDPVREDIDHIRYNLARSIAMAVNKWHGCPEPLCQRHRGCMAPNFRCSNRRDEPPMQDEERARVLAHFQRALRKASSPS